MRIKYSILMPYHDRMQQLTQTVERLCDLYPSRRDWELVVVVDQKSEQQLHDVGQVLCFFPVQSQVVLADQESHNPAPHYNQAAKLAKGEVFIITSPEVRWQDDILAGLDKLVWMDDYYVFACQSINQGGDPERWYQHSEHRPANYHFCSALSAQRYAQAGGFDEDYRHGIAYDDDDWLMRVQQVMTVIPVDNLVTHHLWHTKPRQGRRSLVEKNRKLFEGKWPKEAGT